MIRIDWSARALSDLESISEYIERDRDLNTANCVAQDIYRSVQSLRMMPYRGRPGRLENTRELVVPHLPWLVVYRVFDGRAIILNILHGARRWP